MQRATRKIVQKIIAIVVIVALLDMVGVSSTIIIFFVGVGFLVWRAAQRAENQETERVFDFYISADEILRDKERQWYGFEIAEVIESGEQVLSAMPDPPPLCCFALGALYQRVGDYEAAANHLAAIVEDDGAAEHRRAVASPQLRRYVELLRRIEREPAFAPQALAAIRSLERARRQAVELLTSSREQLAKSTEGPRRSVDHSYPGSSSGGPDRVLPSAPPRLSMTVPPPIREVLHDVYDEEQKTG